MKKSALLVFFLYTPLFAMKNFVLISAPGSGKGTFSQYFVEKYGYQQICPGDIFRAEIEANTDLGQIIKPIVESGQYVDEEIVCALVKARLLASVGEKKPFILDGFPRSEYSFNFLIDFFKEQSIAEKVAFLQLKARDKVCINRMCHRLVCTGCSHVYNDLVRSSATDGECDKCTSNLKRRPADTQEIAVERLAYFHTQIESLMQRASEQFGKKNVLVLQSECSQEKLEKKYENIRY